MFNEYIPLSYHDHACTLPVHSVTVQTLILHNVFEVGNFTYILAMWPRAWADASAVPIVSHYPNPSNFKRVGSQWGTPAQSVVVRIGQTNHHSLAPAGWGGRKTTLIIWRFGSDCFPFARDLTAPAGNAVPFTPTPKDTEREKDL